ncbi:hypothetical protein [Peribacillus huizhouensis]|uniref:DinB-like domain-containing protein n=1 Tax=Peribacillus huizhouensis TaxID=1501239 RepID=A0ABR6CMW7_9BACI|nr:hypothetical protein [Peribacillus huizhouensis]MBA9026023.1 hypothetical protein [Peribacillus huizhouensis]
MNDRLQYLFKDTPLPKAPNEEELNCKSTKISRNSSKEETITNFMNVGRKLIIAVHNIEDELWDNELTICSRTLPFREYLKDFINHDLHHFEQSNEVILTQSFCNNK